MKKEKQTTKTIKQYEKPKVLAIVAMSHQCKHICLAGA
jgi:hypothetical protein